VKKRLEIGSGYNPTPGYYHLDANPELPDVDLVGLAFPLPASVHGLAPWDELRAVDVLEHLSYRDVDEALADWRSVVGPDGRLYVQVPDAETIMREYVGRSSDGLAWDREGVECDALLGAEWRLLGGHADGVYVTNGDDWRWNAHYSLWSKARLSSALDAAGWVVESIDVNRHPNLLCTARAR
jgi:hypothetical protein